MHAHSQWRPLIQHTQDQPGPRAGAPPHAPPASRGTSLQQGRSAPTEQRRGGRQRRARAGAAHLLVLQPDREREVGVCLGRGRPRKVLVVRDGLHVAVGILRAGAPSGLSRCAASSLRPSIDTERAAPRAPAATARASQPRPRCSCAAPRWASAPPPAPAPARMPGTWSCRRRASAGCTAARTCRRAASRSATRQGWRGTRAGEERSRA